MIYYIVDRIQDKIVGRSNKKALEVLD